jgi:hypothetical protein
MPCYHPNAAWYSRFANPTGKHSLIFKATDSRADTTRPIQVPCGRCIGCRLDRSRKWAIRCEHERQLHEEACFITLTYRPEDLPPGGTLFKRDFQLFMKRYRKFLGDKKIRYYMCGEYGEKRGRPHYHAIIFGHNFLDREVVGRRNGITYFTSPTLQDLWGLGGTQVGDANFQTAAYCARYITKKLTGKRAEEYGEKTPEYNCPSRKPGLAADWIKKYMGDVYPKDEIKINGTTMKPPKFYDSQYEILEPEQFEKIKENRKKIAEKNKQTGKRLKTLEQIQQAKNYLLKRGYENG